MKLKIISCFPPIFWLILVQDNFNEAEFWYKKALKIFKGEGNENGVVLSESNLVEVNKVKGDWRETERYLKSIMKYDREKNLTVSWGIDYFNIAHLRYLKYDFSKALRYIEKAVVLFRKGNQLTGIVECEFLKTMIYMINRSYRVDLSFLKKNLRILTSDQRIVLSIIGACKKNGLNESISSTIEKVKKITSVTLQYELMSILVKRYRIFECLDFLKSLSMRLSKKTKNFYYYDFYYLYFDIFFDDKKDDEDQRKIFYDMYYFFLRNKRKMSSKIIHLKKYLDDKDSISDIFKSFELVGDYIHCINSSFKKVQLYQ